MAGLRMASRTLSLRMVVPLFRSHVWIALSLVAAPALVRAATDPWSVHAGVGAGFPSSPTAFRDGAKTGVGMAGGVLRALDARWSLGLEGEFVQFRRGDVEGADLSGGARRFGRVGVPLRLLAHEHDGNHRIRWHLEASAGYAHASREAISGTATPPEPATRADGIGWTGGVIVSGLVYENTRAFGAVRATGGVFPDESPVFIGLVLGIEAAPARR